MPSSLSTRALAASWLTALVLFATLAGSTSETAQQAPAAGQPAAAPAQPAAGRAGAAPRGQGRGRGPAPVDTLGAGPWEFSAGRGSRMKVSVVTKGVNRP